MRDSRAGHQRGGAGRHQGNVLSFFLTLVTGPRRSSSLQLSDTRVSEPQIRARLGTTWYFFLFFTLVAVPTRSLSLKLGDTGGYEHQGLRLTRVD